MRQLGITVALVLVATAAAAVQLEPVLDGLSRPIFVTSARDGTNRLFVVEQAGIVKVLQPGSTTPTEFLNIMARVRFGGEQGLLGLAFHPGFRSNRRLFVNYTRAADGATVVSEFLVPTPGGNTADPNSERVLLVIAQPFVNHNAGWIGFGPDGFLHIATGDGGSANDPGNRSQDIEELLGKVLRIDVDQPGVPYGIPPDNPFVGVAGRDEIFAFGFRNPWRMSFDRLTGVLVAGDVGQAAREEVDVVTSGDNYGWRVFEGTRCTNLDPVLCADPTPYTFPVTEYAHAGGRCSITGGYMYRGTAAAVPAGAYVFGDFCSGEVFQLEHLGGGVPMTVLLDTAVLLPSFGETEAGEILVVDLGGTVRRLGNGCAYALDHTSGRFSAIGGPGRVRVSAAAGCAWSAVSQADWITVSSVDGLEVGTVRFSVAPNTTCRARVGTLSVAGELFVVRQGRPRGVTVPSPDDRPCELREPGPRPAGTNPRGPRPRRRRDRGQIGERS